MLFPVPGPASRITHSHPPGTPVLSLVRGLILPTLLSALISTLPDTRSPITLALPLVFSFLQTRQATKVLNATRVPSDSPPATMMPSSGTSTRVASSPAGGLLVRFREGGTPNSEMPQVRLCPPHPSLIQRAASPPVSVLTVLAHLGLGARHW